MPKKRKSNGTPYDSKQSKGSTGKSRNRETYVCNLENVLRYEQFHNKSARSIVGRGAWQRMRRQERVEKRHYEKLAREFRCDISSIMIVRPPKSNISDPIRRFTSRIVELIDDGTIPLGVDVVDFAWNLEDNQLRSIPISHYEQVAAFNLVARDYHCLFVEQPREKYGRMPQISRMFLFLPKLIDTLNDLTRRRKLALEAFDQIKRSWSGEDNQVWFGQVKLNLRQQFNHYQQTIASSSAQPIDRRNLDRIIDADQLCRSQFFRYHSHQAREFQRTYTRSAWLLRIMFGRYRAEFFKMWPQFLDANTIDLKAMIDALHEEPVPNFQAVSAASATTINRTERRIRVLYERYLTPQDATARQAMEG